MGNWAGVLKDGFGPAFYSFDFVALLKVLGLAPLVYTSNPGTRERFKTMLVGREHLGFLEFLLEWIVAIGALLVTLFHPSLVFRLVWGALIAVSTGVHRLFCWVSGNQMSVFDLLSLMAVKNWTADVSTSMKRDTIAASCFSGFMLLLFVIPVHEPSTGTVSWIDSYHLAWLPLICLGFIVAEIVVKKGDNLSPMPTQFSLWSMLAVTFTKSLLNPMPERRAINWEPAAKNKRQNILLLVDESVRGDYVSFKPGNLLTPGLAPLADKLTCFGPAVSGGNSSSYSNVILRFGAEPHRIASSVKTNPSIFAYAKKAGYRTVYIDAQSGYQANGSGLQNFMTLAEKSEIDQFYVVEAGSDKSSNDLRLADIVASELKSAEPVFIYANKNGVHYPYQDRCPKGDEVFTPRRSKSVSKAMALLVSSYRNGVHFAVEKFMLYLFAKADLSNTTLIYTSDHGQWFSPGNYPHGMIRNPDPRTGIVPLWAYSSDQATVKAFEEGAKKCQGRASHFLIAPTLYELMGYARGDIAKSYEGSMLMGTTAKPRMTTGDIFGLFGTSALSWEIDLERDYFEHDAQPERKAERISSQPQGSDQVLTLV